MTGYGDSYRGEGFPIGEGCVLPAHFLELQAFTDALGHAAQLNMADQILEEAKLRELVEGLPKRSRLRRQYERALQGVMVKREQFYAHWLAYGWLLRAIEGNTSEMDETQKAMLARIDWTDVQRPAFRFPGFEAFAGIVQHLPGEAPEDA